jgi:hypothetical protein
MAGSNLEPWEEALLRMPPLEPSDSISNISNQLSNDNSWEPEQGPYAKFKRDNDDWGLQLQKQRDVRTKTLLWIQNYISTHPEGINDTSYALAQPSIPHNPAMVPAPLNTPTISLALVQTISLARNMEAFEADFPALSSPKPAMTPTQTKLSPVKAQAPVYAPTAEAIEVQKSLPNKTYAAALQKDPKATQRNPASIQKTPAQSSDAMDPGNSKCIPSSSRATTSKNANPNSIELFPQLQTQNAVSSNYRNSQHQPNEPCTACTTDSANDAIDLTALQALLDQEIAHMSRRDWKECRCDQCYEEHKSEYSQHKGNCEDCAQEHMNHELLDGKMMEFWEMLERKFLADEEICKLCRWKRDEYYYRYWYPAERVKRGLDEDTRMNSGAN